MDIQELLNKRGKYIVLSSSYIGYQWEVNNCKNDDVQIIQHNHIIEIHKNKVVFFNFHLRDNLLTSFEIVSGLEKDIYIFAPTILKNSLSYDLYKHKFEVIEE